MQELISYQFIWQPSMHPINFPRFHMRFALIKPDNITADFIKTFDKNASVHPS